MNSGLPNLRQLDLNLLVVFDVLMQERNVSKAAKRVFLSQPAMSNALSRLRNMLDDPLLVRTSRGMEPTPRARDLEGPVRSLLAQMAWQLKPQAAFHPASTQARFVVATTDYSENVVIPRLSSMLSRQAPHAVLETRILGPQIPEKELERGEIQLVVGVEDYMATPGRLQSRLWIRDRLVCLVQPERQPIGGERISLKQFLAAQHVYPSPLGVQTNIVDSWLEKQGLSRRIALTTRSYLAAALIIQQTDYVLSLPEKVATTLATLFGLKILQPPKGFPGFRLNLIWHPLYENDPSQRWLLEQMKALDTQID